MPAPKKFTEQKQKQFLSLLANGNSVYGAAEAVGITYEAIRKYRRQNPEYDEKVKEILDSRTDMVVDALYASAMSGNVTAMIFWLANRSKNKPEGERWQHVNNIRPEVKNDKDKEEAPDEITRRLLSTPEGRALAAKLAEQAFAGEADPSGVCGVREQGGVGTSAAPEPAEPEAP